MTKASYITKYYRHSCLWKSPSAWLKMIFSLLMLASAFWASADESFYRELLSADLKSLTEKGRSLAVANPDSAMEYFTFVAARYDDAMKPDEKKLSIMAMNDLGYLYFFHSNDPIRSYSYLLRAHELSEETGIDNWLPHIYLNMANVYTVLDDYDASKEYFRKSIRASADRKTHNILLTSMIGLVNLIYTGNEDDLPDIKDEIELYRNVSIPDETPMKHYCDHLLSGVEAVDAEDFESAFREFGEARKAIDTNLTPERYEFVVTSMEARAHMLAKDYGKAIGSFNEILCLTDAPDVRAAIYQKLADYWAEKGDNDSAFHYTRKYVALSDTILHSGQIKALHDIKSQHDIMKLNERIQAEARSNRRLTAIIWVVVAVLIAGASGWVLILRRRRRGIQHPTADTEVGSTAEEEATASQEPELKPEKESASSNVEEDSRPSEASNALVDKIRYAMETSPEVYGQDFSIERLASIIDASPRKVSATLNQDMATSFSQLLQEYRIREACRRLKSPSEYGNLTIEGIAESLGFKSRSNFVQVFKKITGKTPSEYQRDA